MNSAEDLSRIIKKKRSTSRKTNASQKKRRKLTDGDSDGESDSIQVIKRCKDDGDVKEYEKR